MTGLRMTLFLLRSDLYYNPFPMTGLRMTLFGYDLFPFSGGENVIIVNVVHMVKEKLTYAKNWQCCDWVRVQSTTIFWYDFMIILFASILENTTQQVICLPTLGVTRGRYNPTNNISTHFGDYKGCKY